jgi:pimeloyl-ACP methyl ester carboxylesterase
MIFVHGFFGDAWSTWEDFQSLPDEDPSQQERWHKTDLYFYEYRGASNFIVKSAQDFTAFVSSVYPQPNEGTFSVTSTITGILLNDRSKPIRPHIQPYRKLILIGHSLGGVVLRYAVADALRRCYQQRLADTDVPTWLRHAHLCLFAPAHRGFRPSSWKALLMKLPYWGSTLAAVPVLWRAYSDLQPHSALIEDLQRRTKSLGIEYPDTSALRARCAFGSKEDIVEPLDFDDDIELHVIEGVGHTGICKPNHAFLEPMEFLNNAPGPLSARA